MSINYLNHINLNGNQLQNFLVHPLGIAPTPLGKGHLITLNTANDANLQYWDGTAWRVLLAPDASHKIGDSLISSAAAWNAKYDKPSGGIPNSDLVNSSITIGDASVSLGGTMTNLSGIGTITASGIVSFTSTQDYASSSNAGVKISGGVYIAKKLYVAGATTIANTFTVGSSSTNRATTLYGTLSLNGTSKRIYFGTVSDTTPYIEYDSTNKALHVVNAGLYSDTFVSALGTGSITGGGGGGSSTLAGLNDVLASGDSVGRTSSTAAQNGDLLAFNGNKWYAVPQSSVVPTLSSLTIQVNGNSKGTYNPTGNALTVNITAADLGLSNATSYLGTIDTTGPQPTDGGTQKPTKGGTTIEPKAGDIVVVGSKEFIWTASGAWELFGDEGSYALKTISISGGKASGHTYGLTGGGTLESNRTITLDATTNTAIGNGKTAYGWGNHASAGYLTSATAKSTYPAIKTYTIPVGSTTNTIAYDFADENIIVSIYQGEDQVMADVAIKKSGNNYGVEVITADSVADTALKIVAYGILA